MIRVSEWMPNPVGSDTPSEWVELHNDGTAPASLAGWSIGADTGKPVALRGEALAPGEFRVFPRTATKLALRNTDGILVLRDSAGNEVQRVGFLGTAPEGKSANVADEYAVFGTPTPGAENVAAQTALLRDVHPVGVPLTPSSAMAFSLGTGILAAGILAALAVYFIKRNHDLQELFFGPY